LHPNPYTKPYTSSPLPYILILIPLSDNADPYLTTL